jgi:hypothetical protein
MALGVTPSPRLPEESRRITSVVFVDHATVLVDGKYIPFVGTVDPDGINAVPVALPVVTRFVPLNVSADPVVRALDELA